MPHGSTHRSTNDHFCSNKDQPPPPPNGSPDPSALLAYQGNPPDEHHRAKPVRITVDLKQSLQILLPIPATHFESQTATDHMANPYATVATDTVKSTTIVGSQHQIKHWPSASANSLANQDTTALANQRTLLNKMFNNLITCAQKLKHINEHCLQATSNITKHDNWQTIIQMYTIPNCPPPPAEKIENNIITPLIQCIEKHYTKLHDQQCHFIKQHIHNTYLTLNNDPIFNNIKHLSLQAIQEAFTNFNNYLQNKLSLYHYDLKTLSLYTLQL